MTHALKTGASAPQPWRTDVDDLEVISALVQDAVFPVTEMTYARANAALPCCSTVSVGKTARKAPERVQSF